MNVKIPCTVAILTRNSACTLGRALEGVKDFSDIVVCDGGSTDATTAIAEQYGARVIAQDQTYLDGEGRVRDFSGVRNQTFSAAREAWFFFLDADEYVRQDFAAEAARAVDGYARAYWVPRKYVVDGKIIERSISYPNRQMRFFHRSLVEGFRKPVHEKVIVKEGAAIDVFPAAILVPSDAALDELRRKSERYIGLELARLSPLTCAKRRQVVMGACKTLVLYAMRAVSLMFPPYRGARMPLAHEIVAVRYQLLLIRRTLVA